MHRIKPPSGSILLILSIDIIKGRETMYTYLNSGAVRISGTQTRRILR